MFPGIDIPVVSLAWQYTGLNPEELEGRLTTPFEKVADHFVDNVEHIESTTYNGIVDGAGLPQPGANVDRANAPGSAASEYELRQLPPGVLPPQIISYQRFQRADCAVRHLRQRAVSEQTLNDYAQNFIHPSSSPFPDRSAFRLRRQATQITINLDQPAMQSRDLPPATY